MPPKKSNKKRKKKKNNSKKPQNNSVQSNNENTNNIEKTMKDEPQAEENCEDELLDSAKPFQPPNITQEETGETFPSLTSTSHAGNNQEDQTLSAAVAVPSHEQSNVTRDCDKTIYEKVNTNSVH